MSQYIIGTRIIGNSENGVLINLETGIEMIFDRFSSAVEWVEKNKLHVVSLQPSFKGSNSPARLVGRGHPQ